MDVNLQSHGNDDNIVCVSINMTREEAQAFLSQSVDDVSTQPQPLSKPLKEVAPPSKVMKKSAQNAASTSTSSTTAPFKADKGEKKGPPKLKGSVAKKSVSQKAVKKTSRAPKFIRVIDEEVPEKVTKSSALNLRATKSKSLPKEEEMKRKDPKETQTTTQTEMDAKSVNIEKVTKSVSDSNVQSNSAIVVEEGVEGVKKEEQSQSESASTNEKSQIPASVTTPRKSRKSPIQTRPAYDNMSLEPEFVIDEVVEEDAQAPMKVAKTQKTKHGKKKEAPQLKEKKKKDDNEGVVPVEVDNMKAEAQTESTPKNAKATKKKKVVPEKKKASKTDEKSKSKNEAVGDLSPKPKDPVMSKDVQTAAGSKPKEDEVTLVTVKTEEPKAEATAVKQDVKIPKNIKITKAGAEKKKIQATKEKKTEMTKEKEITKEEKNTDAIKEEKRSDLTKREKTEATKEETKKEETKKSKLRNQENAGNEDVQLAEEEPPEAIATQEGENETKLDPPAKKQSAKRKHADNEVESKKRVRISGDAENKKKEIVSAPVDLNESGEKKTRASDKKKTKKAAAAAPTTEQTKPSTSKRKMSPATEASEEDGREMKTAAELPPGWRREVVMRRSGKTAGKLDVYIYSLDGKKHRSRNDIKRYLEGNPGSYPNLKATDFDFSTNSVPISKPTTSAPAAAENVRQTEQKPKKSSKKTPSSPKNKDSGKKVFVKLFPPSKKNSKK